MPVSVSTAFLETTGGRVWDASKELLDCLVHNLPNCPLTVLELGSGCGLLGFSLAEIRPDCHVVLTEREFRGGFDHLVSNFRKNPEIANNATCLPLDWADLDQLEEVRKFVEARGNQVVVVGSELVYNRETCLYLCNLLENMKNLNFTQTFYYAHSLNRFAMIDIEFFGRLREFGFPVKPMKQPARPRVDEVERLAEQALFEELEIELFTVSLPPKKQSSSS